MAEIIEVLTPVPADCPNFTVDVDVLAVNLLATSGQGATALLYNAQGFKRFQANDNLRILSVGIILPEQFTLAKTPYTATLGGAMGITVDLKKASSATYRSFPQFGSLGTLTLPLVDFDFPVDIFIDINAMALSDAFNLRGYMNKIGNVSPQVSMVNAPAALDATLQTCILYVKVLHNFPMIADS